MWGNSALERAWQETKSSGNRGELWNVATLAFALYRNIQVFCPELQVAYVANEANRQCHGPELVAWKKSRPPSVVFACLIRALGKKPADLESYRNSMGWLCHSMTLQVPVADTSTSGVIYRQMLKAPEFECGAYVIAPENVLDAVRQVNDHMLVSVGRACFHFSYIPQDGKNKLHEADPATFEGYTP